MAVYHRVPHLIQLSSHPLRVYMPKDAGINDWCFSHLPGAQCFIQHYCANKQSKQHLAKKHALSQLDVKVDDFKVHSLKLNV